MGKKAEAQLEIATEELRQYLMANHSAYMEAEGKLYYLTDANDIYWRAQDTDKLNEKGHYVDCSELVPTVDEFLALPFMDGKAINDVVAEAKFYASEK